MNIKLLEYPTEADWLAVKQRALVTVGLEAKTAPTDGWKRSILEARHSPIRRLRFSFLLEDIPSWVSVHLVRHIHAQPYVRSQRNDRQDAYDRTKAPQDAPVTMIWDMNAEELMVIANKRLCSQASQETRQVVGLMCQEVLDKCPEFEGLLVPMCRYHGGVCHEMMPCGLAGFFKEG
jgi:thymidylate synthase ThyX